MPFKIAGLFHPRPRGRSLRAIIVLGISFACLARGASQSNTAVSRINQSHSASLSVDQLSCTVDVPNLIAAYGDENIAVASNLGPTYYLELPICGPHLCGRPLTVDDWARSVVAQARVYRSALTGRRTADVLVFVHGYAEHRPRMSARMRVLRDDLHAAGFMGAVTALNWPSSRKGMPFTYLHDIGIARKTAWRLVTDCLDPLRAANPPGVDLRLHVLSHSLGATYVRAAFQDMPCCPAGPRLENLIFFGGDVAACSFGSTPCLSLAGAAAQSRLVTTYGCDQDRLLMYSEFLRLGFQPRLGRAGLEPTLAAAGAVAVNGTARYETLNPRALSARWHAQIAADDIRTRGCARPLLRPLPVRLAWSLLGAHSGPEFFFPSHEWYFQDPVALRDLRLLLQADHRQSPSPTRCLDGSGCVILRPDL